MPIGGDEVERVESRMQRLYVALGHINYLFIFFFNSPSATMNYTVTRVDVTIQS